MKRNILFVLFVSIAINSTPVAATLLQNGDFEAGVGLTGTQWKVFDNIPGWTAQSGPGIEVQRNTVVQAHSGDQYIELDSHSKPGNSQMGQNVYLGAGSYLFEFFYQPRTNHNDDNGINYFIGDLFSWSVDGTSSTWPDWGLVSQTFEIVRAGDYNVGFNAFGDRGFTGGNTLGGFIDSASLTPVPEPATMFLFGTGLLGLAGVARRRKN